MSASRAPPYFEHMEKVNLDGGMAAGMAGTDVPLLDAQRFAAETAGGLVISTRQ